MVCEGPKLVVEEMSSAKEDAMTPSLTLSGRVIWSPSLSSSEETEPLEAEMECSVGRVEAVCDGLGKEDCDCEEALESVDVEWSVDSIQD